ncbi:MAG: radical SAM protein [Elusimicrobia bacterium]|nr:radical SAM protein [Elusimicrobiota bacterium]
MTIDRCPELLKAAEDAELKGDYDKSLSYLDQALEEGFKTLEVYYARGRVLREASRLPEAIKSFKKALDISQASPGSFHHNRLLNEIEICQGKEVLESKPRGLGIVLTTRCNLRCIMCNSYKVAWDLPEKTAKEVIDLIPYLQRVMWLGGEVFLSDYFESLFEEALKNPHIHQTVVTDGLLITEKWADLLSRANINLTYSIDSAVPEIYEYIRRGGKFKDIVKSSKLINQVKKTASGNMKTSINCTIMKTNYKDIGKMADFAIEQGFDDLTLTPVDYIETEENIFLKRDPKVMSFISERVKEMEKKLSDAGKEFHNWLPGLQEIEPTPSTKDSSESSDSSIQKEPDLLCYWPWQHLFIDIGGEVKPHCLCSKKVGNVLDDSIYDIWNNLGMQDYRKRMKNKDYAGICNAVCLESGIERESMGLSF